MKAGRSTVIAFFTICIGIVTIGWGTVSCMRYNAEKTSESNNSWPREARALTDHLNEWDFDELLVFNNPDKYPNTKTSGETNGWISAHIEELNKLGSNVQWNAEREKYVLTHQQNAR